jgi:crossover junction endodeoxyribonuclease RusA
MAETKINNPNPNGPAHGRGGTVPPGCRPPSRESLSAFVPGRPAPQGSKTYLGRRGGRGVLVESSKAVKPWRADVRETFTRDGMPTGAFASAVPLVVMIVFVMPRPAATPKTRATPPAVKRPDLDKLGRAVLDALTSAGVFADDSQVVTLLTHKRIAELGEATGAWITVSKFDLECHPGVV